MDLALAVLLGLVWIGLGIFFVGVGVLWWVSLIARDREERGGRQPR
jgi:protein-S-isoprenylcysteine O-methyltransferase Ste14